MPMTELDVDVAIVGGGVIGASIAWQLVHGGVDRVVVIERGAVGAGASALAAGLVSHARSDGDTLSMVRSTLADITALEAMSGEPIGFRGSGSLRVAERPDTGRQLERIVALLRESGVAASFIDVERARSLVPWLDPVAAHSILFVPDDGFVDGQGLAMAYARAARAQGAMVLTGTEALAPRLQAGRLVGVETSRGPLRCRYLIDAAGAWAGGVLGWFGLDLPAAPLRSHYWITAPPDPPWPDHPFVVMPDARAYFRPEVGGLLMGIQEPRSRSFDDRSLPEDLSGFALSDARDWDLLASHAEELRDHVPGLAGFEFKQHLAGLSTYTPDGRFLIGPIPGVDNLIVAAGCCGTGVSCSGGIGRLVRDLVLGRTPAVRAERYEPGRFADVDPRSEEFIARCVASRANKGRRT
jgi:4-methylaminobutanoate oxidase (formaldehyde-forming)